MLDWQFQPYCMKYIAIKVCEKVGPKYSGPHKILEKIGPATYRSELPCTPVIQFYMSLNFGGHWDPSN